MGRNMVHLFTDSNLWILETDREAIRAALLRSGYADELAQVMSARIRLDFEGWEKFVNTDWSAWDFSEYDHEIGQRYGIQVIMEHSCAETRRRLEAEVKPIDDLFLKNMRLFASPHVSREQLPLSEHPYFWETGTIHPEDYRM